MEWRRLRVGMGVGIRPANRSRSIAPRPATVVALIDHPGYRQNRARIAYADNGVEVELPLWRLVAVKRT